MSAGRASGYSSENPFPFVPVFSISASPVLRVAGLLEPRRHHEHVARLSQSHIETNNLLHSNFVFVFFISLDCGRNMYNLERTFTETRGARFHRLLKSLVFSLHAAGEPVERAALEKFPHSTTKCLGNANPPCLLLLRLMNAVQSQCISSIIAAMFSPRRKEKTKTVNERKQ